MPEMSQTGDDLICPGATEGRSPLRNNNDRYLDEIKKIRRLLIPECSYFKCDFKSIWILNIFSLELILFM